MINQVISKRTSVLMALLMLAVGLLVISSNSAYADNFEDPVELPFSDDFGNPPGKNDVPNWSEIEAQDDYCATKNYQGDMFLKLRNGCDAYVTIELDSGDFAAASSLFLTYDWGQHATGDAADDGDLSVYLAIAGTDIDGNTVEGTLDIITYAFEPKLKIGPINHVSNYVEWGLGFEALSGRPYTLEVHFVGTSEGKNDWALVDNVRITMRHVLPPGTVSWSQGGFHNVSEALACEVLLELDRDPLAGMNVDGITGITEILASLSVDVDLSAEGLDSISTSREVNSLCLFLVGDEGGSDACTFLPAGKLLNENGQCKPKSNLASQDITLRLNLNLASVYGAWGDEGVEFRPIELDYYLNIDPVPHPDGYMVYPLDNTFGDEALGTCGIGGLELGLCADGGGAEMTNLGMVVQELDRRGTTVGDMLDAADTLLLAGATVTTMHTINGVELTQLQVTDILSMINKSYKYDLSLNKGVPTGVVTAWDYD